MCENLGQRASRPLGCGRLRSQFTPMPVSANLQHLFQRARCPLSQSPPNTRSVSLQPLFQRARCPLPQSPPNTRRFYGFTNRSMATWRPCENLGQRASRPLRCGRLRTQFSRWLFRRLSYLSSNGQDARCPSHRQTRVRRLSSISSNGQDARCPSYRQTRAGDSRETTNPKDGRSTQEARGTRHPPALKLRRTG